MILHLQTYSFLDHFISFGFELFFSRIKIRLTNYAEKVIKNLGCTTLHIQLTFFFGQLTFKSTSERQKQKKRQKEREKKKETKTSLCPNGVTARGRRCYWKTGWSDAGGHEEAFGDDGGGGTGGDGGGRGTCGSECGGGTGQNMCEQAAWLFLALVLCVRVTELIQHFILQIRKQIQRVEVTCSRSHHS